jgi:hypothetical protein
MLPDACPPPLAGDFRDTLQGFGPHHLREGDLDARSQIRVGRLELAHEGEKLVRPRTRDLVRRLPDGGGDLGANLAPVHGSPHTRA